VTHGGCHRAVSSSSNSCLISTIFLIDGLSIARNGQYIYVQQFLRLLFPRSAPLGLGSSAPTPICHDSCRSPSLAQRGWWRDFFEDHPRLAAKTPESYTNPTLARPDKQKAWCRRCLMRHVAEEQARDEKEVAAGKRGSISIRDEYTIKHMCVFFSC
jgi:hypothetical protein